MLAKYYSLWPFFNIHLIFLLNTYVYDIFNKFSKFVCACILVLNNMTMGKNCVLVQYSISGLSGLKVN